MTLTGLTELLMARIVEDEAAASAVKDICAGVWDVQVVHRSLDLDPLVTHSTDDGRAKLAQHFDQAGVLAECNAMRLVVAIHRAYAPIGEPDHAPDWCAGDWCVGCCYSSNEGRITEHIDDCPLLRARPALRRPPVLPR